MVSRPGRLAHEAPMWEVRRAQQVGATLVLAAALWAPSARAQGADTARAEALFKEGRAALEKGDFATACPKLAESLKLARRPSTLFNTAQCEEHDGHLVRAAERWREGLSMLDAKDERSGPSQERLAAVEKRIARLQVEVPAGLPGDARFKLDDADVERAALGAPIPVDPGNHVLVVTATGRPDQRASVTVGEGELKPVSFAAAPAAAPTTAPTTAPTAGPPPDGGAKDGKKTRRTIGFVVAGIGVVGVGVGAVTGIMTIGKKNTVEDNCVGGCNDASRDAANAGKTLSTVSTIAFAAGGAAVAVGAVLILTSLGGGTPSATTTAIGPTALPGGAGFTAWRSF